MKHLSALLLLMPLPAFAHAGDHSHAGLSHLLSQPDHLAMIVVVVLAVAGIAAFGKARR